MEHNSVSVTSTSFFPNEPHSPNPELMEVHRMPFKRIFDDDKSVEVNIRIND